MVKIRLMVITIITLFLTSCSYPKLDNLDELSSDYTYKIGPGDNVEIFVWDNPDISRSVTVRPDGKINTPLLDDLIASDKTPDELARDIEKGLEKYVREPLVAVMVSGFNGVYKQQVRIIGEIGGDGATSIPYRKEMTLLDLMIEVGGISEFGDGNRSSIIRKIDGERQQFGIKIDDLLEDGDLSANVKILPGDILIVPEAFF